LPLAIATGASANSRHSIGTGVVGGTLSATLIAIFFIPMFYWLLGSLSRRLFGGPKAAQGAAPAQSGPESSPAQSGSPASTGEGS
jgi:multidrug efflux pump